ncbi:hypothetical protein F5Y15DRAFT_248988 [Xylariaceae sp. FL0016]|nr:hypothetical protein F5Y15DRAFT_248988 [Xylariaceae sp. FL0016]
MVFFSTVRTKGGRLRRNYTQDSLSSSSSSTLSIMSTASESSSRPTSRYGYDTGFPESMAAHTTSMRHPDAIVAPGFSISSEDVDAAKTLHRTKRSFLVHKHRRTISSGRIPQDLAHAHQANDSTTSVMPSIIDSAIDFGESKPGADAEGMVKDSAESIHRTRSMLDGYTPSVHDDAASITSTRRRSKLFRKWRTQKD